MQRFMHLNNTAFGYLIGVHRNVVATWTHRNPKKRTKPSRLACIALHREELKLPEEYWECSNALEDKKNLA